jgi:predicted nuclease of predicted toxin-antitoxin system
MLRLYMDVHVKAAITAGLRRRGLDVVTAQEDGGTRQEDAALLEQATALQRVLFNQDDDLLAIRPGGLFRHALLSQSLEDHVRIAS